MSFTPSQRKALSSNRHLAIIANAGSGKTRVLVERYVELFQRHTDLTTRNVVAITFTENAAAELRSRIAKEIRNRLSDPAKQESHSRLRYLRDSLPSAFIGTIHGFASRILKAYPVEANIDAGFTIVQGAERTILEEDAIHRAFYSALEEAYAGDLESDMLQLFRRHGRRELAELIRVLLRNRARARRVQQKLLQQSDDDVLAFWREHIEKACDVVHDGSLESRLVELSRYVKRNKNGAPSKNAQEFQDAVNAFAATSGFFERASSLRLVAKKFITGKGEPNSNVFNFGECPPGVEFLARSIIEQIQPIRQLIEVCPGSESEFQEQHRDYLAQVRGTFQLYDQVLEAYTRSKVEFSLLDFDDLIEYLERLLGDASVREELSQEFRFIMVDEYQDTDESQLELVRQLTEEFGSRSNLAIVGDPKQAIYTFRNADVGIFFETIDSIRSQVRSEAISDEVFELSEEEERGVISLAETFRMTKEPLVAINRLFRSIMDGAESAVAYSSLIHGRETELAGRVEWICPRAPEPSESEDEADDSVSIGDPVEEVEQDEASEVQLLARKIRSILSDSKYQVEENGQLRRAAAGDIAILLRSRTNLALLERTLREDSIPYAVAKGTGFFVQPEILDILSYLTFLINPANDTALAATLRSPFFALSDTELFQIAHHEVFRRRSTESPWMFWDQFQSYAEQTRHTHLERTVRQLRENLALAGRTSSTLLIEKIYSETGIYATFQATEQPEQMAANLDKFLALARSSDASGFSGLLDFVERTEYLKNTQERESQAELPDDQGLVRIMTVHEAKGLEFPIVILPFLQKKFKFDTDHILDKELGLQIKPREGAKPIVLSKLILTRAERATIEEEKRIFYVAATRARDHLILSCTIGEKIKQYSWLSWTLDALGFPSESNTITIQETLHRYDASSSKTEAVPVEVIIPLIRDESDITVHEDVSSNKAPRSIGAFYLKQIDTPRVTSRFSATQLLRYQECPTKYYLSYVLGMPEEPKLAYDLEPAEESERMQGRLLGQIVHEVFARWERIISNGSLDLDSFEEQLSSVLDGIGIRNSSQRAEYRSAAQSHVRSLLQSSVMGFVLNATDVKREFPLRAFLPSGDQLYGILDCLLRDENGGWTILDYKTDALGNASKRQKKLDRYEFQMRVYAYLVHLFDPNAQSIRAILFFTETGEPVEFMYRSRDFANFVHDTSELIKSIRSDEQVPDLLELSRKTEHCHECRFFEQNQCIVLAANQNPIEIPAI